MSEPWYSVWTYDEVARSYYFHRVYHFEPALDTGNPAVLEAYGYRWYAGTH